VSHVVFCFLSHLRPVFACMFCGGGEHGHTQGLSHSSRAGLGGGGTQALCATMGTSLVA
jgi:hypothetical protein